MKKTLLLCLLCALAFGNVEVAKADSFGFGAAGFDDQKTMLENLQTLLPSGSQQYLQSLTTPEALLGMESAYVALIGVSQDFVGTSQADSFWVLYQGDPALQSYLPEVYWTSSALNLSDIALDWAHPLIPGVFVNILLTDLLDENFTGATVSGAYFYGAELVYQPDGYTPIALSGGTIFIGLDLGYGNKVDAIVAFSYNPINAVPVPAAFWLLGSGVAGIVAMRKRIS